MANMRHSGGIVDAVIELGFDQVKYFEGTIGASAMGFSITPPARRVIVNNRATSGNVFLRVNNGSATTVVSFSPGNDIKISPGGSFIMDYDAVSEISLISDGASVAVEGLLGFKATKG